MAVNIEVTLEDNSDIFKDAEESAIMRALNKIGLVAEGYAKRLCPVDTGRLRNSITYAIAGESPHVREYKSNSKHKSTDATAKAGTAGKKAEVVHGEYSGTMPKDGEHDHTVYIGSNVEYAPYVELGTRRQKARPFLTPAAQDHAAIYKKIVEQELENA